MKSQIDQVAHFMEDFNQTVRYSPVVKLSPRERILRVALLLEEVKEFADSLGVEVSIHVGPEVTPRDLEPDKILDHLVDIAYVLFGAVCTCGLQHYMDAGFAEAHRSNMSKRNPDGTVSKDHIGKVIKGPNYSPADFKKVISDVRQSLESGGMFQ